MNSQDNSGKYIDFFTVKLLTSDEGLYKSVFVVLLIYIYAFYIKTGYFSSTTVRNQRNIVIVGGSNHEISLL